MVFYPPKVIRFVYRYLFVGIMVIVPLLCMLTAFDEKMTRPDEMLYPIVLCPLLAVFNFVFIQLTLWEKLFAKLSISNAEIKWQCPMRRTRKLSLDECVEVGAFIENENNGIPAEQVYFSNHLNVIPSKARELMRKNKGVIVFRYSEDLYQYVKNTMNSTQTNRLIAYRLKRARRIG